MNAEPLLPTMSLIVPCCNKRQHIETYVCFLLAQDALLEAMKSWWL
jgi:hypothetical protein